MKRKNLSKRNKKVSQNRGLGWNQALIKGKLEAKTNPSVMRIIRVGKNISQESLAKGINLSLASYGMIERRKRTLNPKNAQNISSLLKTPMAKLFRKIDEKHFLAQ